MRNKENAGFFMVEGKEGVTWNNKANVRKRINKITECGPQSVK